MLHVVIIVSTIQHLTDANNAHMKDDNCINICRFAGASYQARKIAGCACTGAEPTSNETAS